MASPISLTTVVHHRSGADEHWTVLTGTTVIAHCTTVDQATTLADALNDAKRIGDEFDATERYSTSVPSVAPPSKPVRCQGLEITPKSERPNALEPQLRRPG